MCTGHCNQCAAHPGYVGPGTETTWTDVLSAGVVFKIKEVHWDELRDAIDAETTRRSETWSGASDPGNVNSGDKVWNKYKDLRDQIYYLGALSQETLDDPNLDTGQKVLGLETEWIRTRTNNLESRCVCDCNYACTCDCNYCVCDCNYCTCNCNYCTCNCAHACVCNCAYSDRRLKREIKYL